MGRQTRRALLASTAALVGAGAGCTGLRHALEGSDGTPTAERDGPPPTDSPTESGPDSLTLEAVEPPLATEGAEPRTVTVYPESMALALRRAARIEGTYRSHGPAFVYAPEPFWTRYRTVRLTGPDAGSTPQGVYEMAADGGIRYELLVGADRLEDDPPAAQVSGLEGARRELALAAIRNEGPRVYPETELGEWVRTEWFDNRWEHDGTVYRGKEVQQTDAAFFSQQVWATVQLRETRADQQVVFELRAPGDEVRDVLDPVFDEWSKDEPTTGMDDPPAAVVEYLRDVDLLATHTTVFRPRLEELL
jgi:hypothetical protein